MKNVQETSKQKKSSKRFPKSDMRYWEGRIFKPIYSRDGISKQVAEFSVKIQFRGKRETFSLGTANKANAAEKAKRIYLALQLGGWEEAFEQFKPRVEPDSEVLTVGEFLRKVKAVTTLAPRTFANYSMVFRKMVARIAGIPIDRTRFDKKNGGRERWIETIEAVPMDRITPQKIEKWKREFVAPHIGDPLQERKAKNSCNSIIGNAGSLFSEKKVLRHLAPEHVIENPFKEIEFFPKSRGRYVSRIDGQHLIDATLKLRDAQKEEESESDYEIRLEAFKALLLFLYCGPRRKEVDVLMWEQVDFETSSIEIRHTEYFRPKSESSVGVINFDPAVGEILKEYRSEDPTGIFVLRGRAPKPEASYPYYRADKTFKFLIAWLRSYEGADGNSPMATVQKPIHELRKEVGAMLNSRYGLFAANKVLRHAQISTTANYYVDEKEKLSVGLSLKGS